MLTVLTSVHVALLVSALLPQGSIAGEPSSTVTGSVRYINVKSLADFKHDRAIYVHENEQVLVIDVERTLAGPVVGERVIVKLLVDSSDRFSVKWPTPSYGLLSPREWVQGRTVRLVLTKHDQYGSDCAPPRVIMEGREGFMDASLDEFAASPTMCAKLSETE